MHFLFVKQDLCFPRTSGHDVHCHGMMRALNEAGHEISLLTMSECIPNAIEGINLQNQIQFTEGDPSVESLNLTRLQKKFCSYWGIPGTRISQVANQAKDLNTDVVVAVGLNVLPYLSRVTNAKRVWYAADEWVIHHLSQFSFRRRSSWPNIKHALIKGLYERAFAPVVDRTWLVSERDAKWTRRVMPGSETDVVPNGVDTNHYQAQNTDEANRSCVFWGRLDFGPNLDAIDWFCKNVWNNLRKKFADAKFTVLGFKPGDKVRQLADEFQFNLIVDQPDIRQDICAHQIVVLPFVSGAGIKNKLLEAASLSRPIVASTTALNGLNTGNSNCIQPAAGKRQWIEAVSKLWDDSKRRKQLGVQARDWVAREYTWESAAQRVIQSLESNQLKGALK